MTQDEIRDAMFGIIRFALGNETLELSSKMTAKDVAEWDSVRQVMIILGVEEKFGIRLSSREIDSLRNVGDFLTLINAKTNATS
jgi:acyl carrier protein